MRLRAASEAVTAKVRARLEITGRANDAVSDCPMSSSPEPRSCSSPLGLLQASLVLHTTPARRRPLCSTRFEPLLRLFPRRLVGARMVHRWYWKHGVRLRHSQNTGAVRYITWAGRRPNHHRKPQNHKTSRKRIPAFTMSLTRLFNDPFFSVTDFDRLFDEAFARRQNGDSQVAQQPTQRSLVPR